MLDVGWRLNQLLMPGVFFLMFVVVFNVYMDSCIGKACR